MAGVPVTDLIFKSKRKAISALFPYAARLAQDKEQGMLETILDIASKSQSGGFMWRRIGSSINFLFKESSPRFLDHAITIASPRADWNRGSYTQGSVARWVAAVLATPYSEAVGQSVIDALLQIARKDSFRPLIPDEIWAWLKRRTSLPPLCRGRRIGTTPGVVHHIRGLKDTELLKSYFLHVWSEWDLLDPSGITGMETIIREKFCGTGMWRDREDLTKQLDRVFRELNRGVEYLKQHNPQLDETIVTFARGQYEHLKEVLAELDREATKT